MIVPVRVRDSKYPKPIGALDASESDACNLLINSLPEASRVRLLSLLEPVKVKARQVLHAHEAPLKHAFFPCKALLSVVMRSNGKTFEIAMIGDEGFFGLPLFFGTEHCPMTAVAQVPGHVLRMRARDFAQAVATDPALSRALGLYAQAFTVMLAQSAVCYGAHLVEQRAAKWLLMAQDRLRSDEFCLTQEFLSQMLGVRRPTVSAVAEKMQREGLIRYRQGRLTILDRRGLEEAACPCYSTILREYSRRQEPSSLFVY